MALAGAAFATRDRPESKGLTRQVSSLQITLHADWRFRGHQFRYARTLALDSSGILMKAFRALGGVIPGHRGCRLYRVIQA